MVGGSGAAGDPGNMGNLSGRLREQLRGRGARGLYREVTRRLEEPGRGAIPSEASPPFYIVPRGTTRDVLLAGAAALGAGEVSQGGAVSVTRRYLGLGG